MYYVLKEHEDIYEVVIPPKGDKRGIWLCSLFQCERC